MLTLCVVISFYIRANRRVRLEPYMPKCGTGSISLNLFRSHGEKIDVSVRDAGNCIE